MPCLLEEYSNAHTNEKDAITPHLFHTALNNVSNEIFSRFRTNFRKQRRGKYKNGQIIPYDKITNACHIARRKLGYCPMCYEKTLQHFKTYEHHIGDIGVGQNQHNSVYLLFPNEVYQEHVENNVNVLENTTACALSNYNCAITDTHLMLLRRRTPTCGNSIMYIPLEYIHEPDINFLLSSHERPNIKQTDPVMLRIIKNPEMLQEYKACLVDTNQYNSDSDLELTQDDYDEL